MCLTLPITAKVRVAKRDIPVQKVITSPAYCMTQGSAPYHSGFIYVKGNTEKSKLKLETGTMWILGEGDVPCKRVYIGLHSFALGVAAKQATRGVVSRYHRNMYGLVRRVVRMYIPKGARYVRGYFDTNKQFVSYASTKLVWK